MWDATATLGPISSTEATTPERAVLVRSIIKRIPVPLPCPGGRDVVMMEPPYPKMGRAAMVRIKRRIEPRKRTLIKPGNVAELRLGPKASGGIADHDWGWPAYARKDCRTFP